ncbi:MAG: tetratricopeptide repeat protein [Anaerolineales bacterium]|nr:tetratricopeptide repeat protein [Anaerolineales bacterium]
MDLFEDAAAQTDITGRATDQEAHRMSLMAAVDAYQGDLLPSCYDDWIFPERERLSQAYLRILEELVDILDLDQEYSLAIQFSQQLLRQDPLHEDSYRRLMRYHSLNGEKARALRAYHTCADVLEKELGMEPSLATRELYQQLLDREVELEKPSRAAERGAELVGRDQAWGNLQKVWRNLELQSHFILIKGEAGIGKTHLAEEFLRWTRRSGINSIKTRSYPGEGELAYTPVTAILRSETIREKFTHLEDTWLTEISRLLPELRTDFPDLPAPEQLGENWQRQRMFEACAQAVLKGEQKLVVLLDDLQWCDRETLAWLRYMMEFDSKIKLAFVGTLRTEEISTDSPLTSLISDLQRSGKISEIELDPLDQDATTTLASTLWGDQLDDQAAERLFQETEGNPLFVVEVVRSGFLREGTSPTETAKLPPKVQAVIEARLGALSPETRELTTIAAVVGREFDFDLLIRAVDLNEETVVQGLDELWQRRVIRDEGEDGYNFSHDKFREVITQNLSPHKRKYLHRKVAEVLEQMYQDQIEVISSQLAFHFDQGGELGKAIQYYIKAGDQARRVYAWQDAIDYYQRAAELLADQKDSGAIQLYLGWGNALLREARYEEAAEAYQKMKTAAEEAQDDESKARALVALAKVQDRLGKYQVALENADRATALAEQSKSDPEKLDAVLMKGQLYYRLGENEKALNLGKEALILSRKLNDQLIIGRCLNLMGLIHDVLGDYDQAKTYKEQALSIFKEMGGQRSKWWIGNITNNLANTANLRGNFQEAVDLYQQARDTMSEIGDQDWQIMCLVNMGAAKVGLGAYKEAEEDLKQVTGLTETTGWSGLSLTYFFLSESLLGQGKVEEAVAAAIKALNYAKETGAQESLGAAWRALGKVASQKPEGITINKQNYQAAACFKNSEKIFKEVGADAERAHTIKAWAEYELTAGDRKKGKNMWDDAKEIFQRLQVVSELERMDEERRGEERD